MDTIWQYSIRTLLGFILVLLLTRILRKKQISQITFFTYITGIAIGNIAGEIVLNKEIKVVAGITAMTMWTLLTIIIEQISLKSPANTYSRAFVYSDRINCRWQNRKKEFKGTAIESQVAGRTNQTVWSTVNR